MSYRDDHDAALARLDALEVALAAERRRSHDHALRLQASEAARLRLVGELSQAAARADDDDDDDDDAPPSPPRPPRPPLSTLGYFAWIAVWFGFATLAYLALLAYLL